MSTLKPGTLVMVIRAADNEKGSNFGIRVGTIGEVVDPTPYQYKLRVGNLVVNFPDNKSAGLDGVWSVPRKDVIPINDPDADITQEENEVLYTPQGKIAHMK